MPKYVVFSFDDGRLDTYTMAYPILKKYNMPFTLNVCTDFVEHPEKYTCFKSADNKSVEVEHLVEMQQNGVEIACHGHLHLNKKNDVFDNIDALKRMGIDVSCIGFASPNSDITEANGNEFFSLVDEGVLSYVRSGVKIKREGFLYSFLTCIERKTHSSWLFRYLNRKNVIKDSRARLLMSVAVTKYTTVRQIVDFVKHLRDGECVIFMFHSVITKDDVGYGKDNWYFDTEKFEKLCYSLKEDSSISVCTTKDVSLK